MYMYRGFDGGTHNMHNCGLHVYVHVHFSITHAFTGSRFDMCVLGHVVSPTEYVVHL